MEKTSSLDKSPERIRRMFDTIAPWYDFLNHFFSLGIDTAWRRYTARQLLDGQTVPGNILDVCCGTGDLTRSFLKRSPDREFYGIDFSPEMIRRAKRKLGKFPNVQLSVGDALHLPFENDSFAAVAVGFGLRNVGDTERGIAEMVRVCRPGGTVAVLEFSMPTLPVLRTLYRFYFRSILSRIGQCLARNRDNAYNYLPESVLSFDEPATLVKRMTDLGLLEVRSIPLTLGIAHLVYGKK
jgi:demethylmenaquinone methyltransferase/2-methoxy-6-polyprenyl-1,4-benzoquinol methylase